jgi:FKBP-type peptidyl-prolyl cis-trans isomerase SlyD
MFLTGTVVAAALTGVPAPVDAADAPKADLKKEAKMAAIGTGMTVSLEYTLKDDKGVQIETNRGSEPLVYTQGEHQIIPGLEKALDGLHTGQEKDVTVPPDQGYGKVDKEAFQEIPKDKVPAEALKVGTILKAHAPDGRTMPVRVSEVKDQTVVIDFNHPMAGKTLVFHVKVLDVKSGEGKPEAEPKPAPESQSAP